MNDVYFIFKNISSEDYLGITKLPSIFKAEKDINFIEIEGRDGVLTQDLGSYRSVVKTVECIITDLTQIDFICSWLDGSGEVIFSNEPDKKYKATIKNQIEFTQLVSTYNYHEFIIQFECQPHGYSLYNSITTLTSVGTIYNSGSANSKPIIKVFGTGAITLTINGKVINLTNVIDYITINSDLVDCYKDTLLKNNDMSGEFPILIPGNNTISWISGVAQVETVTVVGTITTVGDATVTVTALGMTGSPITISVPVALSDTSILVAGKIRTALNANANVSAKFTVGGTGAIITLTVKIVTANDTTLNISMANGTCVGLTAVLTSINTTTGVAPVSKIEITPNFRSI